MLSCGDGATSPPTSDSPTGSGAGATYSKSFTGDPPATRSERAPAAEAWSINFGTSRRKVSKKERDVLMGRHKMSVQVSGSVDSEGNGQVPANTTSLAVVSVEGMEDRAALIPTGLTTTREDLEHRLVLRLPRLLCVNKQYPRSCGISSLVSVYNYLYSWLGESAAGADRAPLSQEQVMSTLGFEPPFGEIPWGPFTGNVTLIRWFYALNRHFGLRGKAYILYKVHGKGNTSRLYENDQEALHAVKAALRNPNCAIIYHCYNHYMVPIGYQDIPHAQVDFLKPVVPEESCDTTLFIGEVSRGKHEAMYARKWKDVVKDLSCANPQYFNIRHPELGIQVKESKKKKAGDLQGNSDLPPQDGQMPVLPETQLSPSHSAPRAVPGPMTVSVKDREAPGDPALLPPVRAKKQKNLHCLICFRNDQMEGHPEWYENPGLLARNREEDDEDDDDDDDEPGAGIGKPTRPNTSTSPPHAQQSHSSSPSSSVSSSSSSSRRGGSLRRSRSRNEHSVPQ